jgi:hypothetical protein
MPSVKMLTTSAGPAGNRAAGSVHPVTAEEGAALVAGGYAEWVEAPKREERVIETAELTEAPEHAATRKRRR